MPERIEVRELERKYHALQRELLGVEQILGEALGYPRYVDDPKNFPDATEADGFCVGEMTPAALAEQIAKQFDLLTKQNTSFLVQAMAKGTEASSLVVSLAQEQKDFKILAELFEKQSEVLKTTKELLQLREKAVAKHEAHARIWEHEVLLARTQHNWLRQIIGTKDAYIASLEEHLDQVLDLANRLNRMVYEVPDAKMPKAEWRSVPLEFVWWTVDADGEIHYWREKPYMELNPSMWYHDDIMTDKYDSLIWQPEEKIIDIPIGIDWRMLISHRS